MTEGSEENGALEPTDATGYPTVLVIDDSEIALAEMTRILQSAGMLVPAIRAAHRAHAGHPAHG